MFEPITIPFGSVMLYNLIKLKDGVSVEDVELALGEMCNVVKNTYGDDKGGFIGGQVFENSGFISEQGSFDANKEAKHDLVIMTYWASFDQHEKSHADSIFKEKFDQVADYCSETHEIGYKMLWQGTPE